MTSRLSGEDLSCMCADADMCVVCKVSETADADDEAGGGGCFQLKFPRFTLKVSKQEPVFTQDGYGRPPLDRGGWARGWWEWW